MTDATLVKKLPKALERKVTALLQDGEVVRVKLKGQYKEVLVCTDRKVFIVKSGFMTGHTFGTGVFQIPYSRVSSVEVIVGMVNSYLQVSAGGVQSAKKVMFTYSPDQNARTSPHCVSIAPKKRAKIFQEASSFIMSRLS